MQILESYKLPANFEVITSDYCTIDSMKNRIVICDEIDALIDTNPLKFDNGIQSNETFTGMVTLAAAAKVIGMSATYDDYHTKFIKDVLNVSSVRHLKFKSMLSIVEPY